MKECIVTFLDGRGLICFVVTCTLDGKVMYKAVAKQDELAYVCRRWLYMHVNPFPGVSYIGGKVWEHIPFEPLDKKQKT